MAALAQVLARLDARLASLPPGLRGPLRLLWYGALAVLVTWPIVTEPTELLLGHPEASAPCHVWVLWWAREHIDAIETDLIFHPHGADVVTLYGSDVLSPLLLRPLPLPPTLLYNLWVMFLLVVGGLGVDRVARRVGATAAGGVLAGTIFSTAPFLQHEALNGTSEIVGAAALPWFLLALLAVLDDRLDRPWLRPHPRSLGRGVVLGVSFGLAVSVSAYNLFFGLLMAGVVLLARLSTSPEPVFRPAMVHGSLGAVFGVAPFGAFLAWLQATHGAGEVYSRRENWASPELAMPDSFAHLDMWLDPSDAVIPAVRELQGGELFEYWTTCTVYLGLVAVALAALGWWRRRRDAPVGTLVSIAVVAVLIASGPYLRWEGEVLRLLGQPIALPSLLVAEVFPPFTITAVHAYRYASLVVICVAVLAGLSLRRPVALPLLLALVLTDAVFRSPVPWPVATTRIAPSPALQALAQAPEGAVLHFPIEAENLGDLGEILVAQTLHGKPVQDGGIHRRAGQDATALFRDVPLVADLGSRGGAKLPGPRASTWGLGELRKAGYRYLLTRRGEGRDDAIAWADALLGRPVMDDGTWLFWAIEEQDVQRQGQPEAARGEGSDAAAP